VDNGRCVGSELPGLRVASQGCARDDCGNALMHGNSYV
jgi:hypothetical protein